MEAKYIIKRVISQILVLSVALLTYTPAAGAITDGNLRSLYYDSVYYSESDLPPSSGSGGGCYVITAITINDPAGLAQALEDYIEARQPDSPFVELGQYFVSGGQADGVNPLLLVGLIQKESAFGTAWGANSPETHNAFNRRATSSQPNIDGWYKYDSWEASLDGGPGADDIPTYINRVYIEQGDMTIEDFMNRYAPPSENDTELYIQQLRGWMQEMIELAGDSVSCGGNWTWPFEGGGSITSCYGPRGAPTAGASTNHPGVDIADGGGNNILAAAPGEVTFAGVAGSAGKMVIIDHGDGHVTRYMHNSRITVQTGETVTQGQQIAVEGATGNVTGPHLHFEILRNEDTINPLDELVIPAGVQITGSNCSSANTGGQA